MNELQIFKNDEFGQVRTTIINDEPYFVGKDVAGILGYSNLDKAIRQHVDPEDKQPVYLNNLTAQNGSPTKAIAISESGLYSLIFGSKLEEAKRFKRWITSEVLPTIRKHGMYATAPTIDKIIDDPDYGIQLLQKLKEEREQRKHLETMNAVQAQQIEELQPKASYYDVVLNCKDLLSISKIAKDYGWSAVQMNRYLHEKGVQYKQGDIWLLYQKHSGNGYTNTKTHSYIGDDGLNHSKVHTYWTQKGRLFIYDLLKADGVLPIIEREQNE